MAYNLLDSFQFISAGDMSSNITSQAVSIKNQDDIGIQLNWTGTPVGTFAVQVSVDHSEDSRGNVLNAGNWVSLALSANIAASGSADQAYIELTQLSAPWIRVVYTAGSSVGTLNGFVVAKGV